MCDLRRLILSVSAVFIVFSLDNTEVVAQSIDSEIDAITNFIGNDSVEELDPLDLEKFENLLSSPLKINIASESKLLESGLLTQYQIATLVDYRKNHGSIYSIMELGAIDGFDYDFALRLSPFVSLASGQDRSKRTFRSDVKLRSGFKYDRGRSMRWIAGTRVFCDWDDRLSFALSFSKSFSGRCVPQSIGGNVVIYAKRNPLKFILGDFNIRFGQGLSLWNGMGISGISSPSTFVKKPSGVSASSSFSSEYSFLGAAVQYNSAFLRISSGVAMPNIRKVSFNIKECTYMPFAELSWFTSNGVISASGFVEFFNRFPLLERTIAKAKIALSQRWTLGRCELFSEACYDWIRHVPAILTGVIIAPCEYMKFSSMLRYYSLDFTSDYCSAVRSRSLTSNEHSVSFAAEYCAGRFVTFGKNIVDSMPVRCQTGTFYIDMAHIPILDKKYNSPGLQIKAGVNWRYIISEMFAVKFRVSEKYRSSLHSDMRGDFQFCINDFYVNLRFNCTHCKKWGFLGYMEGGYKNKSLSAYLRSGVFFIDNWDDRIYVYERDSPGAFNIPAFYGRGLWAALSGSWKFSYWGKLYVRLAMTSYPFAVIEKKKPGQAELKFQVNFRF